MSADVTDILHDYRKRGEHILFEGAQGSLLDIDLGTYPYVTSSNTTAGGTATGSGFGPLYLDYVLGITKAYTTCSSGPFPTELFDAMGEHLAVKGNEVHHHGSLPPLWLVGRRGSGHAIQINVCPICLTKLDVLDGLETGRCVVTKRRTARLPVPLAATLCDIEPVYEELPGWNDSTVGLTSVDQLPENAKAYIRFLEEQIEAPIDIISTGPDRIETITLRILSGSNG